MAKSTETTQINPVEIARNGWLAYLGLYGTAYDRIKSRLESVNENTDGMFGDLVAKGEEVENVAQDIVEDIRERANDLYGDNFAKVRKLMPANGGNDRVSELEAEIEVLNKKVKTLSKKAPAKRATAKKTTKTRAKAA